MCKWEDVLMPNRLLLAPKIPAEDDGDGKVDNHAEHPISLEQVLRRRSQHRPSSRGGTQVRTTTDGRAMAVQDVSWMLAINQRRAKAWNRSARTPSQKRLRSRA